MASRFKFETAIEFAGQFALKKIAWKKNSSRGSNIGGRRHVRDLVRRYMQIFRARFGAVPMPQRKRYSDAERWTEASFENVKVVISPARAAADGHRITAQAARRDLRRVMRESVVGTDAVLELVSAKNVPVGSRRALVAESASRDHADVRGLYLEGLGAAIVPGLTQEQVKSLEADGAIVIDNDPVVLGGTTQSAEATAGTSGKWHLAAINIDMARSKNLTGKGVTIGILDTGVDSSHPEFAGKAIDFCEFDKYGKPKSSKAVDFQWHGTHVAALSAGASVGVAPGASLAVAAVLTTKKNGKMAGYPAQILGGFNWLASKAGKDGQGVDILNISFGNLKSEVEYFGSFWGHHVGGGFVVAAIGNDGSKGIGHHSVPARFEFALGVGACDANFDMAPFSSWGRAYDPSGAVSHKPDLVAPGVAIWSALPEREYGPQDGTSMACPVVSGAAALLIEQDDTLRRNPATLKRRILELTCALPTSPLNSIAERCGKGRLDLSRLS